MEKQLSNRKKILLSGLRRDGEKSVSQIAKEKKISKSTIFNILRTLEDNKVFKQKALLDFEKVGYTIKNFYVIKTNMRCRTKLRFYLKNKLNVNSLYDLGLGADFLFEIVFKNFKEVREFERDIEEKFEIFEKKMFNVIEDVKIKSFLSRKEDFNLS